MSKIRISRCFYCNRFFPISQMYHNYTGLYRLCRSCFLKSNGGEG